MDALPDEILLFIFSFCKVEDLTLSVRNVCSRWRNLSEDELLWEQSVLHVTPWLVAKVDEMLQFCHFLHGLVLYSDIDDIAGKLQDTLPLCSLKLWSSKTPHPGVVHALTRMFPHLREFGIMFRDCNVWDYMDALSNLLCVQRVSVSYSGRERGFIRTVLLHCPTLTALNISGSLYSCFWLNDDDLLAIIEERSQTLESLSLDGVLFTAKSLSQLSQCGRLHTLDIGSSDISPDKLTTIKDLAALRCLDLHHAKTIPSEFYSVFFSSPGVANLTELKLFQCRFTDSSALLLARNCPKLKILKLKIISKESNGSDENLNECEQGFDFKDTARDFQHAEYITCTYSTCLSPECFSDEGFLVLVSSLKYLTVFEVVCEGLTDKYFHLIINNLRLLLFCRIRGRQNHFSWPPKKQHNK